MATVPEYFGFAISIVTLLGIGWKGNEQLNKIKADLATNTQATKETKLSTEDSSQEIKNKIESEFIRLQKFNGVRYREIAVSQTEQHVQIAQLIERVKKLEERIDAITRNNQP